MIRHDLEDHEWGTLIGNIKRGNCILMLGPNVSLEKVKKKVNGEEKEETRPLKEILANQLAERIKSDDREGKIKPGLDPGNLVQVVYYYCKVIKTGRDSLKEIVADFYKKRENLTGELHENLAVPPFYFTISTSPDRMFFNALEKHGKKPFSQYYDFQGETFDIEMGSAQEPLVFNLYGTIDDPDSLVLTENDLVDFLVAVVKGEPPLPIRVISELDDNKKSFLFLGFGFEQWYLRVLLHVLRGDKKEAYSFALEQFPTIANEDEFQQTILFFEQEKCNIHIYNIELEAFVKNLRERYEMVIKEDEDKSPPGTREIPPPAAPGPRVFICHAGEDKDFANFLYEELKKAGFTPWLDKESLRGGDEWEKEIEKAIKNEIDYVIVLQSNHLAEKIEGYVNKEINMALKRQETFRRGIRFILPVIIDDGPLLEELKHLHTIDLSDRINVKEVIITIRRDQKKRKGEPG
jgi:hypothetical protein